MRRKQQPAPPILIIGAGIIGIATALSLQRQGEKVLLLDRLGPAAGASFGNGGVLAASAILPVTTPDLMRKIPPMLMDRDAPLFVKWSYLPKIFPWLMRYLRHANVRDTKRIAKNLKPIIADALSDHQDLARGTGAEKYIAACDYLYLYPDRRAFEKEHFDWALRKTHSFMWEELEGAEFHHAHPHISGHNEFALRLPNHGRITSPSDYLKALIRHFETQGGAFRLADVESIVFEGAFEGRQVKGVRAGGTLIPSDRIAITAGMWSRDLLQPLGLSLPMQAERGYHLDLWHPNFMPEMPIMVSAGKFVITPMQDRLRLAGIVEFGGMRAVESEAPFALLERQVRTVFPSLTWQKTTRWMGFRPALPDSLPLIGEMAHVKGVFLGGGHHHIGLTGGAKTGHLLASLMAGQTPNLDLSPYSPNRFAA